MARTALAVALTTLSLLSALSGCNRDQDQTTPVGQEQGRGAAQDYSSTRNMEQSNPAVGGDNSPTNKQAPATANQQPPTDSR